MHLPKFVEPSKTNQDAVRSTSMLYTWLNTIHSIAKTQLFGSRIVCLIIYWLPSSLTYEYMQSDEETFSPWVS